MIALGLAANLTEKLVSGRLSFYVNLRFAILTLLAIGLLCGMAWVGLSELFSESARESEALPDGQMPLPAQRRKKSNWITIFFFPIAVALLGLSAPVIIGIYLLVFCVGLARAGTDDGLDVPEARRPASISQTAVVILALPLMLATFVPARALSTSSLSTRGISLSAPVSVQQQSASSVQVVPDDRTVLDWIRVFDEHADVSAYLGNPASVIGFVYHDPRLKAGQFMVGRFAITCCVADAFAIGMVVDWPDAAALRDNAWVNVQGTLDVQTVDGLKVPVIHAQSVEPVQAPEQPYLYP
jgi:uncharacterized repeat protein (TIGR03943 family)